MPTEISQLRPEGVSAAVEFAGAVDCKLDPKAVDPQVSLLAKDGDTIVAAILGVRSPGGACELHVCFGQIDDPGKLTGQLLNKALMKVHGAGARRCQITYHGSETQPTDWPGPKWTGENKPPAEAHTSPPDDADTESPEAIEEPAAAQTVADAEAPAKTAAKSTSVDEPQSVAAATPEAAPEADAA